MTAGAASFALRFGERRSVTAPRPCCPSLCLHFRFPPAKPQNEAQADNGRHWAENCRLLEYLLLVSPMKTPPGYERKFADFIKLCSEAKSAGQTQVLVAYPWVLGDTYEELIESLSRLADADLSLHIAARKDRPSQN